MLKLQAYFVNVRRYVCHKRTFVYAGAAGDVECNAKRSDFSVRHGSVTPLHTFFFGLPFKPVVLSFFFSYVKKEDNASKTKTKGKSKTKCKTNTNTKGKSKTNTKTKKMAIAVATRAATRRR